MQISKSSPNLLETELSQRAQESAFWLDLRAICEKRSRNSARIILQANDLNVLQPPFITLVKSWSPPWKSLSLKLNEKLPVWGESTPLSPPSTSTEPSPHQEMELSPKEEQEVSSKRQSQPCFSELHPEYMQVRLWMLKSLQFCHIEYLDIFKQCYLLVTQIISIHCGRIHRSAFLCFTKCHHPREKWNPTKMTSQR